jgi:hypothetical protein
MPKVNLADTIKDAEKEGLVGSGVFKPQEGANRVRIVAGPLKHAETYQGEPRFKWLVYVLDRADGQVKPYFMPHSIMKMIKALQETDDYAFDEIPMPFDITINAKGAGTRDVEYSVVPARKSTPLTPDEQNAIDAKQPIEEYQRVTREKRGAKTFDPDEVPL